MKPFDLEAAKAGAPVCMRDGMEARIICFDRVDLEYPIIALYKTELGIEHMRSFSPNGLQFDGVISDEDLMMRDDDYAEKLARGEYGKHIDEATEKVDPVIKENLTVDRERLRRELSEKIMVAMIRELAGKSPHSTSSNITVFEAVAYADAVLEDLDKKK